MKRTALYKIGRRYGFESGHFHRLLHGKRNLIYPKAKLLADELGVDPVIFLKGGGTPEQRKAAFGIEAGE